MEASGRNVSWPWYMLDMICGVVEGCLARVEKEKEALF